MVFGRRSPSTGLKGSFDVAVAPTTPWVRRTHLGDLLPGRVLIAGAADQGQAQGPP
jgi:hypothetical protein